MLLVVLLGITACEPCGDAIARTVDSPDGERQAVVFGRDCRATTGFNTQVSVVRRGEWPTQAGNALIIDDTTGRLPAELAKGPRVEARWLGPRELELRYDPWARLFKQDTLVAGVRVRYVADSTSRLTNR